MELLEYLDSWLSEKIKIKENKGKIDSYTIINIIESDDGAELKELPILYKNDEYRVLAFTLDENNLNGSLNILPIYTRTLHNSSDAILFVQEKNDNENLYIFYIELKSEYVEGILKKHIFMKALNMEILKLFYFRSRLSDNKEESKLEFPRNIYEGMIIFKSCSSSQEMKGRKINYQNYETKKFKGEFINKAKKSIIKINVKDGKPKNRKIYLKSFINSSELEKSRVDYYECFDKKL
ncbi:hypothetical protein [Fusobacterium sp. SYSU M8D902]|uniref:hypothetical protein n=1 Tax=Fusobacterium sp. SYSU M8D902 TaxID=3159562 RepID=UPI0032E391C3